jgi:hypothetical protein
MRGLVSVTLVVCFTAAACGGGDNGNKGAYVDAIAKTMEGDKDFPLEDKDARCLAGRMVDAIGVDTIEEAGVTPEEIEADDGSFDKVGANLSEEQASKLTDAIFDGGCVNMGELFASSMAAGGLNLTDEQAKCLGDEIVKNDDFKQAFADTIVSGTDDPDAADIGTALFEIMGECDIDPTDLAGT